MKKSDFKTNVTGEIVDIGEGYCAFVPAKLPPSFTCQDKTLSLVEQALLALGELRAIIPYMPNARLLTYPFTRREAVLSSKIEGTHTELEQLYLFETEEHGNKGYIVDKSDARQVHNYVVALGHGIDRLKSESPKNALPICNRLIAELHEKLFDDMPVDVVQLKMPGKYRPNQAFIGSLDLAHARYVAPPAQYIAKLMDDLERYIHSSARYHATLVRIAIAHYQFEAIHPFVDGNGRVGRLLISLLLADWKILPEPLLYLSAYFERNVEEYRRRLWYVSCRNDWDGWVRFFLQGVCEVARDATVLAKRVIELRENYRQQFQKQKRGASSLALVDYLFTSPFITVPLAAKVLNMSSQAARKNVNKLVEAGILLKYGGTAWRTLFVAKPILSAIQDSA